MNLINKVVSLYLKLFKKNYYKIIKHNLKYFETTNSKKKKIILVEFNHWCNIQVALSYLSSYLSKKYNSEICAYPGYKYSGITSLFEKLMWFVSIFLGKNFLVYKSFGVKKFILPSKKFQNYLSRKNSIIFKNKSKFLNFKIDNIKLGDAIYDSYLKENQVGSANIQSMEFYEHFKKNFSLFLFWKDFLKKNKVKAICSSHSVYHYAILVRLGIKNKIPTYVTQANEQIYRLDNKYQIIETHFKTFPKLFKKINNKNRKTYLSFAKKKLSLHLKGKLSAIPYVLKSSFSQNLQNKKLFRSNNKIKILIASQCFIDSPHNYGNNLFPDHLHWLKFLSKFINNKNYNYEWFLKTHNDLNPISKNIILNFLKKNKNIKYINENTPNNKIAKDGMDFVLTCWGSVGFEYAAMGVNVINASQNNPHIAYNFNYHPKSVKEYSHIIKNLKNYKKEIDKNSVLEYFFMKFYFYPKNWLLFNVKNPKSTPLNFGNSRLEQTRPIFFNYWTNYCNTDINEQNFQKIKNFVDSNNYCFEYENLGCRLSDLIKTNAL